MRARGRSMTWWARTAQKSGSRLLPNAAVPVWLSSAFKEQAMATGEIGRFGAPWPSTERTLNPRGYGRKGHQGCVSHTILKLSHSPHDLAHSSTCCRHCTAGLAWSGRPGPDCEAVLQRVCCCTAQPQCSLKEPRTALLVRHEVDRLGSASSASNKSGSCASLLSLHASVGATICGARTNAGTQLERVARCRPRFSGAHRQA